MAVEIEAGPDGLEPRSPRRGRPMDAGRDACILGATIELLEERGYDQLTVKDIAERAGAGLGAIYRRWPTKLAVVVAALQAREREEPPLLPTGDPAEDLTQALLRYVDRMEHHHIPGFLSAMRHEPDLAAAVRECLIGPKQKVFAEILRSEFDAPAECQLRAEMALALPLQRLAHGFPPPDEREIRDLLVPVLLARCPAAVSAPEPKSRA